MGSGYLDTWSDQENVLWKADVPGRGNSSPIIWGDRIFLTGVDNGKLVTLGLDRATGKVLWTAPAPAEKLEAAHRIAAFHSAFLRSLPDRTTA